MKLVYCFKNAINFITKGITSLSLLILFNATVYSNPIDKNTVPKTGCNFFTEISSLTFRPNSKRAGSYSTDECTYTLSANREASAEAGNNQVTVTISSLCTSPSPWTATSNADWIILPAAQSGTGAGSVAYTYKANMATTPRPGTITIAGQIFTVNQAGRPLLADKYEPNNTIAASQAKSFIIPVFTENASTVSISPATCHTATDLDIYKINLEAGYIYTLSGVLYDTDNNQANYTNYTLDVKSSYSTNGSIWNEWGGSQLPDMTVQGVTLYIKIEPHTNRSMGTYAAKIDLTRTVDCSPGFSPSTNEVSPKADNDQLTVTIGSLCTSPSSWTATSNADWITLTSGQSGTGSGIVAYTYKANMATLQRTGTITIAGKTFTIKQGGRALVADRYEPNNTVTESQAKSFTPAFTENASSLFISPATCHTATDPDIYKINLEAGYIYTLRGVLYDTDNNQANHTNYTLDVKSSYSTDGSTWDEWGGSQLSNKTISGATLYIKIIPYTDGSEGTYAAKIDIIKIAASACTYTLLPANREATTEADSGEINITTTGTSCVRTAVSNADWITLTAGQSGSGGGSVAYTYQANRSTYPRTGTITIAGQIFTINQAGRPLVADGYEPNNTIEESQATSITPSFTENASTVSISPATCHNSTDLDIYKINLEAEYIYTLRGVLYDTDNNHSNHTNYTLDVKSSYSTDGSTWVEWGGSQLSNKTISGATLYIKIIPLTDGSEGTYAAKIDIIKTAASGCTYTLSANREATPEADSGEINITTTGTSCVRTATSNANWITLTAGQSGTGAGSVAYTYQANMATFQRTGTIAVAGQIFTINQAGRPLAADSYEPNNSVTASQATSITPVFTENASIVYISSVTCHTGTDLDIYNIKLEGGYSYTISGLLYDTDNNQANHTNYTLNVQSFWSSNGYYWDEWGESRLPNRTVQRTLYIKIIPHTYGRTGTYAAKIELRRTVDCSLLSLSDTGKEVKTEAGRDQVAVITAPSCSWEAIATVDWIVLTSQSGTGSGAVEYSYTENPEPYSRTGRINISGQFFTVTQVRGLLSPDSYEPNNTVAEVSPASTLNPSFIQNVSSIFISPVNCHRADDVDIYKINLEAGYSYAVNVDLYDRGNQFNHNYTLNARISSSTDGANWSKEDRQLLNLSAQGALYLKINPFSYGYRMGTYAVKIDLEITGVCTYILSATSREVTEAAGTDKIEVTVGPLCEWIATSNADWITITSGQNGKGSGSVEYSYSENNTEASRTGTITMGGQTFTVSQSVVTGIETTGHVKIFPNPAKDFVTIDFSGVHIKYVSVKIANQLGQILYVQDSPNGTLQIPLKGFTGGVYFVFLQGEEKRWVQKLVVH